MKITEIIFEILFFCSAVLAIAAVAAICLFLVQEGMPALLEIGIKDFALGQSWKPSENKYGVFSMMLASFSITAAAVAIAVPLGVFTAIFVVEFCPDWICAAIKTVIGIMSAIPSVVYGLFGLMTIVPMVKKLFGGDGASWLAASLILAIMIVPTVAAVTESILKSAPQEGYLGSLALGADKVRSVFFILIPSIKNGIISAAALAAARAIGETTAVMMVSGNQVRIPQSLLKGVRAITANIALEIGYAADLHRSVLVAAALLLFITVFLINVISIVLGRKKR